MPEQIYVLLFKAKFRLKNKKQKLNYCLDLSNKINFFKLL